MRYILSIIFILFLTACSHTTLKPTPVVEVNTTIENEFITSVIENDINTTIKLLEDGINPNLSLEDHSAIEIALRNKNFEMFKTLLEFGANPMEQMVEKAIHLNIVAVAASYEDERFLRELFNYGVDPKKLDNYFIFAGSISTNRINNLKFLIKHGFNVNAQNVVTQTTPLMLTSFRAETSDMTKILLENGADVNITDYEEKTALLQAINGLENSKNIEYLLQYGSNLNFINKHGVTPVLKAIAKKDNKALKLLINSGADIESIVKGIVTPLIIALEIDNYKAAKLIVDKIKHKDERDLYNAMVYAKHRMFNFLLDNGYRATKYKLPKELLNIYLANNRDKELKEYFNIYGLDDLHIKYLSIKVQKRITTILDELYENNSLNSTRKNYIAYSLDTVGESQRAYKWLNSIDQKDQTVENRCYISANVGQTDVEACKENALNLSKQNEYSKMSWAYLLAKEYDESIKSAKKAVKNKDGYYAYANLAHSYLLQGKKEKAYDTYKNYFVKEENTHALSAIKRDFEMLKLNYPDQKATLENAFKYCQKIDEEVMGNVAIKLGL